MVPSLFCEVPSDGFWPLNPDQGPAFSSFRAEGCGMLSLLRFLHHVIFYHNITEVGKIALSTDNEAEWAALAEAFNSSILL